MTMNTLSSAEMINPRQLAARWCLSEKTLERWRMQGTGPAFFKLGGRVLYAMEQIHAHERSRLRAATGQSLPPDTDLSICHGEAAMPW